MKYKYIIAESHNPYHNLALENYLFDCVGNGEVILFLWQNDNTIVVGKNQIIENECNGKEFVNNSGILARRLSGGGAVYHDLGNQNYSLICKSCKKENVIFHEIIAQALACFDIYTEFNGRNDILVNGRKFSGNAFYDNGSVFCQHGTILVDSNVDKMSVFLTPNSDKLKRNGVNSISSRVINLSELDNSITVAGVREVLIDITEAKPLNIDIMNDELERKIHFFSDYHWIYGGLR